MLALLSEGGIAAGRIPTVLDCIPYKLFAVKVPGVDYNFACVSSFYIILQIIFYALIFLLVSRIPAKYKSLKKSGNK